MRKPFLYAFAVGLGLLGAGAVLAWSGPCGASPSACNVSAPLNISNSNQVKAGGSVTLGGSGAIGAGSFCLPGVLPTGGCITSWAGAGGGQWATSGNNIYNTNSGNVSIGPPNASYFLNIENDQTAPTNVGINNSSAGAGAQSLIQIVSDGASQLQFANYGSGNTTSRWGVSMAHYSEVLGGILGNGMAIGTFGATPLILGTNSAAVMRITPGGNVGIGTANPQQKLDVAGAAVVNGQMNAASYCIAGANCISVWPSSTPTWASITGKPIGLVNMPDTSQGASSAWSLAWKNYGNHMIVDMSAGTAPNGSAHSNTNAEAPWSATYPTLMGWNGNGTFGVRVDSARLADSANAVTFNGGLTTGSSPTFAGLTVGGSAVCTASGANCPAGSAPAWASVTGKPVALDTNLTNGRIRMMDVGCNSFYASTCDANVNGLVDAADTAGAVNFNGGLTTGSSPTFAGLTLGGGITAASFTDINNGGYYVDPDQSSRLNSVTVNDVCTAGGKCLSTLPTQGVTTFGGLFTRYESPSNGSGCNEGNPYASGSCNCPAFASTWRKAGNFPPLTPSPGAPFIGVLYYCTN